MGDPGTYPAFLPNDASWRLACDAARGVGGSLGGGLGGCALGLVAGVGPGCAGLLCGLARSHASIFGLVVSVLDFALWAQSQGFADAAAVGAGGRVGI